MKKYRVIFSAVALFVMISATVFPVQAASHPEEPYQVVAYHVDMDVSEDNVISIKEEIDVYFHKERHGIYRAIPRKNEIERADGTTAVTRAQIRNISCSENYEKSRENDDLVLYIGDEDTTVTGDMHYTISYDYVLGQDVAEGYDELYFNIIGTRWDSYIDNASFKITMPKEFDTDLLGFSTGGYGFTGTDIVDYSTDGKVIEGYLTEELEPGQALTVRIELEEGYFCFDRTLHMLKVGAMTLIPLACLIFVLLVWLKFGRDKKVIDAVEFYPPEGMNSVDVAYWYKGKLTKKDIVGLLIELANEGYIVIREGEEDESEYTIERIKPYPMNLDEDKKIFFDGLFESGKEIIAEEDLKDRFYQTLHQIISKRGRGRIDSLTSVRMQFLCRVLVIGCFIGDIAIFVNSLGGSERYLFLGVGIALLIAAFWMVRYVTQRTQKSQRNLEKITGFKKFLETAEKDRLELLVDEEPKYFYNILPFAYVLDVSDKWMEKFEGIVMSSPEWYMGRDCDTFDTATMWNAMNQTMNSAAAAMTSVPAARSSGGGGGGDGGGGGVSGGGSGGGGGGSW